MEKMYKVGYGTGVFDILHDAHLTWLLRASALCEKLIIGVSTDEVVLDYKHHLPAIPFEQRIRIISNLKCVDKAIPQTSLDNKLEVCQAIGADVLFSCEEYLPEYYQEGHTLTEKEQAGVERWQRFSEELNAHGIDVVYLGREKNISSTDIKNHITEDSSKNQNIVSSNFERMEYTEGENLGSEEMSQ